MIFNDEDNYRQWIALVLEEQKQLAKARAIAEKAAFNDLPPNEQRTYVMLALQALKETEQAS